MNQLWPMLVKFRQDDRAQLPAHRQSDLSTPFNLPKRRFRRHQREPRIELVDFLDMRFYQAGDFLSPDYVRMALGNEYVRIVRQLRPIVANCYLNCLPVKCRDRLVIDIPAEMRARY